jgi:hypothetical protein
MGGGRGDTDFLVGMLLAGPLDVRSSTGLGEYLDMRSSTGLGEYLDMRLSSTGLGEYLGLTPGLVARGLTSGTFS